MPCIKLKLLINLIFCNSKTKIFNVLEFNRSSSCLVSPKLLTSSMLRKLSVVEPASELVCLTIRREIVLIFLPKTELIKAIIGAVIKKIIAIR